MERNGALHQVSDLVLGLSPVNLATAANTGKWVSMANVAGMNCILISGIGTAGEDCVITMEQAKDSSGTGAKALTLREVAEKVGGTGITAALDKFVRVASIDRDNPASSLTNTDSAENDYIANVFVLQQDLDINNGFRYIRMKVADVGSSAQLGCIVYIPSDRNYKGANNVSLQS